MRYVSKEELSQVNALPPSLIAILIVLGLPLQLLLLAQGHLQRLACREGHVLASMHIIGAQLLKTFHTENDVWVD